MRLQTYTTRRDIKYFRVLCRTPSHLKSVRDQHVSNRERKNLPPHVLSSVLQNLESRCRGSWFPPTFLLPRVPSVSWVRRGLRRFQFQAGPARRCEHSTLPCVVFFEVTAEKRQNQQAHAASFFQVRAAYLNKKGLWTVTTQNVLEHFQTVKLRFVERAASRVLFHFSDWLDFP